ncbi:hypothetical protein [Marinicella pacifica]|nr:hypothetical protein [Marinicella pacifica]
MSLIINALLGVWPGGKNEQTFDAARADFELDGSHLQLVYVNRVNRIW